MTYQEAIKHLDQGPLAPLYLVSGEETFFIQQILKLFKEKGPHPSDFNFDQFEGETLNTEAAVALAQTYPLFSSKRLIIIKNADLIKNESETLLAYLENPAETTTLVLVAAKTDQKKKIFSAAKKHAVLIQCQPLYENQIPSWITQAGRKKGLTFTQEALHFLKEHCGRDLFLIQQEMDKLALHLSGNPDGNLVSAEACQQIVGAGSSHSIFKLIEALCEKELKETMRLVASLFTEGEPPLLILRMILRQWKMMAIAREALDEGLDESVVGEKLSLRPSHRSEFFQRIKIWRTKEIQAAFHLLLSADSQLKGGVTSPLFVLEGLMIDLIGVNATGMYTIPFRGLKQGG